jgi:hypothetical protein
MNCPLASLIPVGLNYERERNGDGLKDRMAQIIYQTQTILRIPLIVLNSIIIIGQVIWG